MDTGLLLDQKPFLSTSRAETPILRAAWAFGIVSLLFFVAVLPNARIQIGSVSSFVPVYTSILVLCDLITAIILLGQFVVVGHRGLLFVSAGYLFTAAVTSGYALVFPGFFAPAGLFGAGPQTTSAMYMFWHAGFPLLIVAYCLSGPAGTVVAPSWRNRAGLGTIASVLVVAAGYTAFATAGHAMLPAFLLNNVTTLIGKVFLSTIWGFSFAAFLLLWFRRPYTVLDVWLLFVMLVWIFDLALSAIFNGGRYDLGWYFGRVYGLLGAGFLLAVLLTEFVTNYGRLVELSVALRETNQRLKDLSLQDGLTGLANRRSFDEYLSAQLGLARREQHPLSLVLVDIDHFKQFNDSYGHLAGDECLRQVAAVLQEHCRRPADRACRYGGEEFGLILPDTDQEGAEALANRVRQTLETVRLAVGGDEARVTLSGGVASLTPQKGVSEEELIRLADGALYRAKQQGRNRVLAG